MLIYLRRFTNNDTKKQIETTLEAYEKFFGGSLDNPRGVTIDISNSNKTTKEQFVVSKAGGAANSYRFSSVEGTHSFASFIKENEKDGYSEGDILKIEKQKNDYRLQIIYKDDPEYNAFNDIILKKQNTVIITDDIVDTIEIEKNIDKPYQRIFFGAPGTGKSFELARDANKYFGTDYERVTFHPNYMYGNFVGSFKPFPVVLPDGNESITYRYIPGPLMRKFVEAMINRDKNYLVLIEELNRANTAAVFGDFFQLLDRDDKGESEYPITTSEEVKLYLKEAFKDVDDDTAKYIEDKIGKDYEHLVLPSNLYIWATMNSADQGVMPMDTAFKRRWEFYYISINNAVDDSFNDYLFRISNEYLVKWDDFRREINRRLSKCRVPEDKLLGPFFISKAILDTHDLDKITEAVKSKVLMYLYEDAAKSHRYDFFSIDKAATYSDLCSNFEENGRTVFKTPLDIDLIPDSGVQEYKMQEENHSYGLGLVAEESDWSD